MHGQDFEILLVLADTRRLKGLTRQLTIHELKLLNQLETAARFGIDPARPSDFPHVHPPAGPASPPDADPSRFTSIRKSSSSTMHYISIGSANLASRAITPGYRSHSHFRGKNRGRALACPKIRAIRFETLEYPARNSSENSDVHLHPLNPSKRLRNAKRNCPWFGRFIQNHVPMETLLRSESTVVSSARATIQKTLESRNFPGSRRQPRCFGPFQRSSSVSLQLVRVHSSGPLENGTGFMPPS